MEQELIFISYTVMCETLECSNGGIEIVVEAPLNNPNFMCGVCGTQITNCVPVTLEGA